MADPFADAGFSPLGPVPGSDPFAAAGFTPTQQAAALQRPAMPEPIGADEYGTPIFDSSTPEGKAAGQDARRIPGKIMEGATLGLLPHMEAAASMLGGMPYSQGLKDARDFSAQTSKEHPTASMIAEAAGGLMPGLGAFRAASPLISAASNYAPRVGGAMARALLGAGLGGGSEVAHEIGSGDTANMLPNAATAAGAGAGLSAGGDILGKVLQAAPNMGRGLYQGVRNIATGSGREGVAGQVLREASGAFPNDAATSSIPGITLNAAQATGNPGVAALTNMMAPDMSGTARTAGSLVQGGRTPDQMSALARALVPGYLGEEPATLLGQASNRGVSAITSANDALKGVENRMWNDPALSGVALNGPGIAGGVSRDVAEFPASWRDAVTGPQAKLGAYLRELHDLGPGASIPDVNSVRSRLLGVARDAASGPQPDSVTASAANRMAGSILDHIGNDPAITGAPAATKFFMTEPMPLTHVEVPDPVTIRARPSGADAAVSGGDAGTPFQQSGGMPNPNEFAITKPVAVSNQVPVPIHIRATAASEVPGNPAALQAYQNARDFTRQFNQAKGYTEFGDILHPNAQGNMQGNTERQFGRFFDAPAGTQAGLQRLSGLADFARENGLQGHADELGHAARDYMRTNLLNAARRGGGVDATGAPIINPATLSKAIDVSGAPINQSAMIGPIAPELNRVGDTAALLNRPSTLRGDANSTTFEKLRSNDLVSAVIGQSGSSALGAAAGGYGGYRMGDETGVPGYLSIPGGMLAGALAGQRAGPVLGKAIAHTPLIRGAVAGPSEAIQREIAHALASLPAYERAMAAPMLSSPSLGAPGAISNNLSPLMRALIPSTTGETAR